jgi:hypothetical protein
MWPPDEAADDPRTAAMKIGDLVLFEGRRYYLRGLDPMSVSNRQALLEDAQTGEEVSVPADDVEAASNGV